MTRYRSKTAATWIALFFGSLGLHRVYLHGWHDRIAWLHPLPTLVGAIGAVRMATLGQDDKLAWVLLPVLGLMWSQSLLAAIVYGLTRDEDWDRRFNPGLLPRPTRWGPVLGAIAALMIGATVLMSTLAFTGQRYFEWQAERQEGSR
jgi:hypothetical protein